MNSEKHYLYDLGRELALLAKRIETESQKTDDLFQRGRRFAMYEVLSIMSQQAKNFGINELQIGLEGVDIEKLLS